MKVNVVSRKLIRPCTPTPPHLTTYKISLLDELNAPMHVIRLFYYSSPPSDGNNKTIKNYISSLEESLAKTLPLFPPLAGRYNRVKHEVNCNDEGAMFSTSKIDDIQLKQLIHDVGLKPELANDLLPLGIGEADDPTDPMLAVRVSLLPCGGLVIGMCASHRVFDSASLGIFMTAWSNEAINGGLTITPDFDSPSYFPGENLAPLQFGVSRTRNPSIITARFVFGKEVISELREKLLSAAEEGMWARPPSRVVVASAFLTQAILRADTAKHGKSRPCAIGQAINVRERTVPPVSKYACGTWVSMSFLEFTADESDNLGSDIVRIVSAMRKATMQGIEDCPRILSDKEFGRWVMIDSELEAAERTGGPDMKVVTISDWSKFGDYELDFGFGKPVWVSLAEVPIQDFMILMNTAGNDGIEAWVFMHESDVPFMMQEYESLLSSLLITK